MRKLSGDNLLIENDFKELEGHNRRVKKYAINLAKLITNDKNTINIIANAALHHDIGKRYISRSILNKKGKLTSDEFEEMKKHSLYGELILRNLDANNKVCEIVKYHHESFDGTGYPDKLKGYEIPVEARIIKICDVFDALTSKRPYRVSLGYKEAIEIMIKEKEKFDPMIFNLFKNNIKLILKGGTFNTKIENQGNIYSIAR